MIYQKLHIISGTECGANAELSIVGAFSIVQDSVTELLGTLKIDGITEQVKYGGMWVFSKNKVIFQNTEFWGTRIFIESCISKVSLVRFEVETLARTENNVIVFQAKTEICGIDLLTKKIRTVDSMGVVEKMIDRINAPAIDFSRITLSPQIRVSREIVKASNIDFCHHTNNVEYIRFIVNSYSLNELYDRKIKEFQIDYINQSYINNILNIYMENTESNDIIEIKNEDKAIVKCELVFSKNRPRYDEKIY